MSPIWTRTQFILLILSSYFPDGICNMIVDLMKELEFEDARKEHINDCILFRAKNLIGDVVNKCKNVSPDFLNKTLRHVDYHIENMKFHREFQSCMPVSYQYQNYEDRYPIVNRCNEQYIPQMLSWQRDCFAFKILDKVKMKRSHSFLEYMNILFHFDMDRYCLGSNHYIETYNNQSRIIRINQYINKDSFVRKLKRRRQRNSMKIPKNYKGSVFNWLMYDMEDHKVYKKKKSNQIKIRNRYQKSMKRHLHQDKYLLKNMNPKKYCYYR